MIEHSKPANPCRPVFTFFDRIETNASGHEKLLSFFHKCKKHKAKPVELDFSGLEWIDANLSAVLAAFCYYLKNQNEVTFFIPYDQLQGPLNVLTRNGLSSLITDSSLEPDDHKLSTIPVCYFNVDEVDSFAKYITYRFLGHRGAKSVQPENKERIKASYFEIFDNAGTHSETRYPVFTCGQFFPRKQEMKFTLVDLGCGFLSKIASYTQGNINNAEEAIKWALQGNTTKQNSPGGTGLSDILKYCAENKGSLHIVTDDCYWAFNNGKKISRQLMCKNKGATLHLIFSLTL